MITVAQIRAARGLLGWSQGELAEVAKLSRVTVARAETTGVSEEAVAVICGALTRAGVIFVEENGEGPGVRLRKQRKRDVDTKRRGT